MNFRTSVLPEKISQTIDRNPSDCLELPFVSALSKMRAFFRNPRARFANDKGWNKCLWIIRTEGILWLPLEKRFHAFRHFKALEKLNSPSENWKCRGSLNRLLQDSNSLAHFAMLASWCYEYFFNWVVHSLLKIWSGFRFFRDKFLFLSNRGKKFDKTRSFLQIAYGTTAASGDFTLRKNIMRIYALMKINSGLTKPFSKWTHVNRWIAWRASGRLAWAIHQPKQTLQISRSF